MSATRPLLPSEAATAYHFPKGRSAQKYTVALIQLGGSFNPQDILDYCDKYGYKRPELYIDTVDGASPEYTGANGADGEVCLDICMAAAITDGGRILVVFAPNTEQGFADAIKLAADHPLNVVSISISWGAPISQWTAEGRAAVDANIQYAESKLIPTFVASGDNGSKDGLSVATTDYPSSSPFSLGCGGTRLTLKTDGSRDTEMSWSAEFGNGATGGGYTTLYPEPVWQVGKGTQNARNVPDISGNGDPVTGFIIKCDGSELVVGGTSAVAPMYAAMWLLIVSRFGKNVSGWHEVLYSQPVTVDVVGGNNGDYQCTTNYDLCTGLGAVDGEELLKALAVYNNLPVLDPIEAAPNPVVPVNPQKKPGPIQSILKFLGGLLGFHTAPSFAHSYLKQKPSSDYDYRN